MFFCCLLNSIASHEHSGVTCTVALLKGNEFWVSYYRGMNKVILNWQRPLWEGDQEVLKRSGNDEPMWVVIHKC
jgi:hypothetical protein